MALRKITRFEESSSPEFRSEAFNNHAQFDGGNSVDGNTDDATLAVFSNHSPDASRKPL